MFAGSAPAQTPAVAALPATPPAETQIFPLSEIRRGLEGVAYTVFEGVAPEPMRVEILGTLKNALGPGKDMILVRLHGPKPEYTGVVAGMSGSPVYIDGRLAGALSYRIGQFSKEPIAGVTPIEQMLEVRDEPAGESAPPPEEAASNNKSSEIQPMETPLIFSGFSAETLDRFGDRFRAVGLTPVAGLGGSDSSTPQPEPLVPGSAVSAVLVRGDLSIAGTCTVTYVDPSRLLACGHPMTQFGRVDIPMTKAAVVATLPSPLNAFKIINTTETVGAFTEDRSSAIMGRFGVKARMIPVTVELSDLSADGGAGAKSIHFEALDNRDLTPAAMLAAVYQSLQMENAAAAVGVSYRLSGEIGLEGQAPVRLEGMMVEDDLNPAAANAALYVARRIDRLYGNAGEPPAITGLTLKAERVAGRRASVIESARLSQTEVRAGETITAEVTIRPYHAEPRRIQIPVRLPDDLASGTARVLVSDGASIDRLLQPNAPQRTSTGLTDTVAELNRLHANDRVYVTLIDGRTQALVDGGALTGVPPSMANVLNSLKDGQKLRLNGESVLDAGSAETQDAVTGSWVIPITVR